MTKEDRPLQTDEDAEDDIEEGSDGDGNEKDEGDAAHLPVASGLEAKVDACVLQPTKMRPE